MLATVCGNEFEEANPPFDIFLVGVIMY